MTDRELARILFLVLLALFAAVVVLGARPG